MAFLEDTLKHHIERNKKFLEKAQKQKEERMDKTVGELREEIIRILLEPKVRYGDTADQSPRRYVIASEFVPEIANQILSIFLGQTRDICPECGGKKGYIITPAYSPREAGYRPCPKCQGTGKVWHPERLVMLDEDQTLPAIPFNYEDECREYTSYSKARQDMLRESWRKVIC